MRITGARRQDSELRTLVQIEADGGQLLAAAGPHQFHTATLPQQGVEPASDRFWTAPGGTTWRVWLEAAPRHRICQGDSRASLTFVDMSDPKRQMLRMMPAEVVLDELGEGELVALVQGNA